jgi:hypothetical protein
VLAGADFEAVPRPVSATELATRSATLASYRSAGDTRRVAGDESFYVAVKKSVLDDRWFLSGFLEQYFPGAVKGGAARTLGTKVVSFRIQNDRLYLFDVSRGTATSDVFDPELIVDAFPIVEEREFRTGRGTETYVVIDPAAGLNRFNLVSDAIAADRGDLAGEQPNRFEIELAFSQAFRSIEDGATWQLVFTGYGDRPLTAGEPGPLDPSPVEPNRLRASGTLGMSLRRYRESERYQAVPVGPAGTDFEHEYFFRGPSRLAPNSGRIEQVAAHWAIYPGMKPIEWIIARELVDADASPELADIDLVEATRQGIEGWNQAFGFTALTARVARPGEHFGQDDKNFVILDPNPELDFAFANWRTNPSTGETLGASVYVSSSFLTERFEDDEAVAAAGAPGAPVQLAWEGLSPSQLCAYPAAGVRAAADRASIAGFTGAEKFERAFGALIAHEIGHTLGLRHNFKGSHLPATSSVMDYNIGSDVIEHGPLPGSYDTAAVRFLYGLSSDAPTQPFCTDEQTDLETPLTDAELALIDPDCQLFDSTPDPLAFNSGDYDFFVGEMLAGAEAPPFFSDVINGVLVYARFGTAERAEQAWTTLIAPVGAPIDPALRGDATAVEVANTLVARILGRAGVQHPASLEPQIVEQARLIGRNADGIRPLELRRQAVDTLEAMQSFDGLDGLRGLRSDLVASLESGSLDRIETLTAIDLVARIDRATSPYFE